MTSTIMTDAQYCLANPDVLRSEALAALDTAQPVQVNAMLVELLTSALPDIQDAVTSLNMWARGECLYVPKNGYEDPETRKATIKDVMRSANTLAPRLLTASREIQDTLVHCIAAKQAQPVCGYDDETGNCTRVNCCKQAQQERALLSDAELEQEFCNITGLETGINPAAADTKRALVWFKKGYAHGIKQGGQHD